jgi:predicted nucleic acid-binding protein
MAKKAKAKAFVLDGSVSLAWYFKDEASPYADAVASRFPEMTAVVPPIWPLEVANAVLMGERRKRSTEAQAVKWFNYLGSLPITTDDDSTSRAWSEVLGLARLYQLSAYHAAYLELALRRGLALATLDEPLRAAAGAAGVALFEP